MTSEEVQRIAHTESVFREVNERIAEGAARFESDDAEFMCECADAGCTERLATSLADYEDVRSEGTTFLLAPGHEDRRVETVVQDEGTHAIVEKRHPKLVPLVLASDPRAA
jgi:hypothetical protein